MRRLALPVILLTLLAACGNDEPSVVEPPAGETDYGATATAPAGEPTPEQSAACTDRRAGGQALIEFADFRFEPSCVEMTTSQGFQLRNTGDVLHNFTVEGVAAIDLDVEPGQENNTEPAGIDADVYTFFCKYHRSQGMEGELRVSSG